MSIEQLDKIDVISINQENVVFLTISDHLEWDSENKHLLLLQDKINAYLQFIETGQIFEDYPKAKGRNISISVVAKYPPNEDAIKFFDICKQTLSELKIVFEWSNPKL